METFLWTLAVAAISALSWIAYKHPSGFSKNIFPYMFFWPSMFVAVGTLFYMLVAIDMSHDVLTEIGAKPDAKAPWQAVKLAELMVFVSQVWLIYLAYAAFLLLLRYLPKLLAVDEKKAGE